MKQFNFTYYDIRKATNDIPNIKEKLDTDPRQAILHIYVSGISKKQSEILLNTIDKSLHNVCRIGISEFPARENKKISCININLILAEKSYFEQFYVMCSRGEERNIANDFAKSLGNIQSIKAFEICSANHLTDTTEFIEAIGAAYPDVPIFGSLSKPARLANNTSAKLEDSFFIGDKIYTEGYSIVVYYGENLNVRLSKYPPAKPGALPMNRSKRS